MTIMKNQIITKKHLHLRSTIEFSRHSTTRVNTVIVYLIIIN